MDLEQTCEAIFQLHRQSTIGKSITWAKENRRQYKLIDEAMTKMLQEDVLQDISTVNQKRTELNPKAYDCENYNQATSILKYKTKYALSVFSFFKQYGFGGQFPWTQISEHCNIPLEDRQATKVILINQEYIYKSNSTDEGDLVKANEENIISAEHGLEKKEATTAAVHLHNETYVERGFFADTKPITYPATKNKNKLAAITQKLGSWIISNLWKFILAVAATMLAAYLLVKYKIPH